MLLVYNSTLIVQKFNNSYCINKGIISQELLLLNITNLLHFERKIKTNDISSLCLDAILRKRSRLSYKLKLSNTPVCVMQEGCNSAPLLRIFR